MNQRNSAHRRQRASLVMLVVTLLAGFVLTGCQLPQNKSMPTQPGYAAQNPATHPTQPMPVPAATAMQNTQPRPNPAVQQVAWQHQPHAQSVAACGCGGCAAGNANACQSGPQGYATYGAGGWNAHGIDPNEFLCDGGDHHQDVAVRRNNTLAGLDPEDTVVHYMTEAGDTEVKASNRVCVYAPRFASVRKITGAASGGHVVGVAGVKHDVGLNRIQDELPGLVINDTQGLAHADVTRRIDAMRDRNRGVRIENVLQPEMTEDVLAALAGLSVLDLAQLQENQLALLQESANAAVSWSVEESIEVAIEDLKPPTLTRDLRVEEIRVYDFPDAGRLQIGKFADRQHAQPGEVVSFAIRVENVGDSAVNHVTLTDNLTTRLEYVPDSQTCSGGAVFSTKRNEAESLMLQWKLTDELKVGESVTIRFRCKVR
ncbi:DUF11 domain-containing protein [Novipirellula caenicola]